MYRESPVPLFTWNAIGSVSYSDPSPRYPDDVYLELDGRGRLVTFRAGGLRFRPAQPPSSRQAEWSRLFAAAQLNDAAFEETTVEWPAVFTADDSRAWEARLDGNAVTIEALAPYLRRVGAKAVARLREAGIVTLADVAARSLPELQSLPRLWSAVDSIREWVQAAGLTFATTPEPAAGNGGVSGGANVPATA